MPKNTEMFSNVEALDAGISRAAWKLKMGEEYFFQKVNYDVSKLNIFDHREIRTIAAMFIDTSSVENQPEDVKKEFYTAKLQVFEKEFLFSNDPEAKTRFIKKIYEDIATDTDIDWNNPAEICHLACSLRVQQVLGMVVDRTPLDVLSIYSTKEEAKRVDNISIKNYVNLGKFQTALIDKHPDISKKIQSGASFDSYGYRLFCDVSHALIKATEDGTNVATIDPEASENIKKHLLGDKFDFVTVNRNPDDPNTVTEEHFDNDDTAKTFMESFYTISSKSVNEYSIVSCYLKGHASSDLLFVNGRPMTEIIAEKTNEFANEKYPEKMAIIAAGKIFRDALVDGNSVVSLMRANIVEDGKVAFTHQEIKVDLDKLNKIEREEKHGAFRRFLDWLGIKIPQKYASNAQRDERQAVVKNSEKYKSFLKAAEKNFIDTYNKNSKEKREEEERKQLENPKKRIEKNKLYNAYPEVSNAADENELQDDFDVRSVKDEPLRMKLPPIMEVIEDELDIDIEGPINDDLDKSASHDLNIN